VKRRKGVTIMKKAVIPLVLIVFVSALGYAQTAIYSWRDGAGTVHIVDDLNKVPPHCRGDMKIYRIPSTKGAREPRSQVSSKRVAKVKEGREGTLEGEWRGEKMEEVRGSITALSEKLEGLRQEGEAKRIRMIRKRARGKTVVREKREIEEIDREIEALTDQMGKKKEALRSLEQERTGQGGQ
jgi:hypothetical protein